MDFSNDTHKLLRGGRFADTSNTGVSMNPKNNKIKVFKVFYIIN